MRSVRWGHVDLDKAEWNRPGELMKNRLAHKVTLSLQAVALLRDIKKQTAAKSGDLIFPGLSRKLMSDMTLTKVMKTAGCAFTVHGFRSSFRDWAAEQRPDIPDAVAEAALAHVVPDQVVRAYKRTTFVGLRRDLLQAWGDYLSPGAAA